jgi:hypothetical protein
MSRELQDENDQRPTVVVPMRITAKQDDEVTEAARLLTLSKQATIRLALERGLPVLKAQLTGTAA